MVGVAKQLGRLVMVGVAKQLGRLVMVGVAKQLPHITYVCTLLTKSINPEIIVGFYPRQNCRKS